MNGSPNSCRVPDRESVNASALRKREREREGPRTHPCDGAGQHGLAAPRRSDEEDTPRGPDARVEVDLGVHEREGDELEHLFDAGVDAAEVCESGRRRGMVRGRGRRCRARALGGGRVSRGCRRAEFALAGGCGRGRRGGRGRCGRGGRDWSVLARLVVAGVRVCEWRRRCRWRWLVQRERVRPAVLHACELAVEVDERLRARGVSSQGGVSDGCEFTCDALMPARCVRCGERGTRADEPRGAVSAMSSGRGLAALPLTDTAERGKDGQNKEE